MTAIELLFGVVLVGAAPLALMRTTLGDPSADRRIRRLSIVAVPAAVALAGAMFAAPGPIAAVMALPWQVLTGLLGLIALATIARDRSRMRPNRLLAVATSLGFLAFGAANATSFAIGFAPLGFSPPIVLLTAVHFHSAGFVLFAAGTLANDRRRSHAAAGGVAALAVGNVVTAAGFVGVPGAAVVGAGIVALGGLLIGWATVRVAPSLGSRWASRFATIAGAALFVSMPMAMVWAVGTQLGAPPFDLDVMIRTHGTINALGVAVPVMVGWALDARSMRRGSGPAEALDVVELGALAAADR